MATHQNETVLVGMSGGVDSSVTAALLKQQGYNVIGVTMKVWNDADSATGWSGSGRTRHACYGPGEHEDIEDARKVAEKLEIPFHVIDVSEEYKTHVISYFKDEYQKGRTPNPCVMCNFRVKFGFLIQKAREIGLAHDYFATGHYARKFFDETQNRYYIRKGVDPKKDQSYFLAFLTQDQLKNTLFPLGELKKSDVIHMARELQLGVEEKQESQDFIEAGSYAVLFDDPSIPGPIFDITGKYRGEHKGIIHYTIGQRRGLGISATEPLYVIDIDPKCNSITVGKEENLACTGFSASDLHWMLIEDLTKPLRAKVKVRLTHKEVDCILAPQKNGELVVDFGIPQVFVTPGQVAVFYNDDRVIGGGVIEKVHR